MTTIVNDSYSHSYQAVQSMHAIADFAIKYSEIFKAWQKGSNYLCCLKTNNLDKLISQLDEFNITYVKFYEPDLNNELTAIAVEPLNQKLHKKLYKKLKLL